MKLGLKQKHQFSRLGHKVGGVAEALGEKSEIIGGVAGAVRSVADKVSAVAGTGATLAALSGVGAIPAGVLGSVSAGSKALAKGAGVVENIADRTTQARGAMELINRFA